MSSRFSKVTKSGNREICKKKKRQRDTEKGRRLVRQKKIGTAASTSRFDIEKTKQEGKRASQPAAVRSIISAQEEREGGKGIERHYIQSHMAS